MLSNLSRSTGEGAATFQLLTNETKRSTQAMEEGGRGVGHLRNAMSLVALEATGTAGPIGHLANALLLFGAGSSLTLGVAAGLAVIAGGYRLITKDARDAAESHQQFVDKLNEANAKRVPDQAALQKARAAEDEARDFYKGLLAKAATTPAGSIAAMQGPAVSDQALRDAKIALEAAHALTVQREGPAAAEHAKAGEAAADAWLAGFKKRLAAADVGDLGALLKEMQDHIAAGGAQAAEKFGAELQEVLQLIAGVTQHIAGAPIGEAQQFLALHRSASFGAPAFGAGAATLIARDNTAAQAKSEQDAYTASLERTRAILVRARTPQQIYTQGLQDLQTALDNGAISQAQFDEGVRHLTEDMEKATKQTSVLAVSIINAVSGAIAGIVTGGSAGGILASIGGIVGLIPGGQIAGAVISGIGSIALASESKGVSIDRYSQQALDQLKGIPSGPQRIEFLIVAPTTGEIINRVEFALGQRSRTDTVRRAIPGLIWAGG